MLKYLLKLYISDIHQVLAIVNAVYYAIIFIAISIGTFCIYKKLVASGYEKKKVFFFLFTFYFLAFPLGYFSSRAANMFYLPMQYWSLESFFEHLFQGGKHTFHTSVIMPVILVGCLIKLFRMEFWKVFDIVFLYIPFAHAIARVACLMAGCCHGHKVCIDIMGHQACFKNPVPLYEIGFNLVLFLILRFIFKKMYEEDQVSSKGAIASFIRSGFQKFNNRIGGGVIVAFYLIGYGIWRFNIEYIRTNPVIGLGLTQAQIAMIVFSCIGLLLLFRRGIAGWVLKTVSLLIEKKEFKVLMGFTVSYFFIVALIVFLFKFDMVDWPFRGHPSLIKVYYNVFLYAVLALACSCLLIWVKILGIPLMPFFKWKKFSHIFWVGLLISFGYSIYLYQLNTRHLSGIFLWPPLLMFSVLNAYSEEIVYRLALLKILDRLLGVHVAANICQAFFYGITHFFIGGARFAFFAFLYGLLLGTITKENKSIIPAMICHFIIDIGNIGLPLLIVRHSYY